MQTISDKLVQVMEARRTLRSISQAFGKEIVKRDRALKNVEDELFRRRREPSGSLVDADVSLSPEVQSLVADVGRGLTRD